jgi:hypothetical protein
MRIVLIVFLLLILNGVYSQIIVTDVNSKPIPFVEVLSSNKHFYSQTDSKGELNWDDLSKLELSDTLFFQLISYDVLSIPFGDLSPSDTIKLQERVHELEEFSVVSQKKKNKYQKLEACYRSYQVNDDSVAYYIDGEVTYLSKIDKDKYDIFVKKNRIYANEKIEEDDPNRKISVGLKPTISRPPFSYLPFYYNKKNKLIFLEGDSSVVKILNQDSVQIGSVERGREYIKYIIEDINFKGTNKFLKSKMNRVKRDVILIFRASPSQDILAIENFNDLLYYKDIRAYRIRHDKDEDFTRVMQIDELFIEDVLYARSVNKDLFNSSWRPDSSNYESDFWSNCNCEVYQTPNKYLLNNLYEK